MTSETGARPTMGRKDNNTTPYTCLLLATTAATFLTFAGSAQAQSDTAMIARNGPVQNVRMYNIQAQPLASALISFGKQSALQVTAGGELLRGVKTAGVHGQLTPTQALAQLLSGTGLAYVQSGNGTVILTKSAANITLGPVRVGGSVVHQNPTGPGVGYVAINTMAGTKIDTPLTEIPNSIYVITKQQMVDLQPQNVQEALRYTAGIYTEQRGNYSNGCASAGSCGGIVQRGFSTSQFIDGLMSESYSAGETAFLERIEAVNGPASVMYGQTTPGGMINMSLKKPTDTPLHQVSVGFGNWNRYEATFDYSDKITKSGNLRYRVAAMGTTQGTQVNNIDYKRVGILPSITWDIDKKTSLTLLGSYLYTPGMGTNYMQFPVEGTLYRSPYGQIPRSRFVGNKNFNTQETRDEMFEYQFQHRFNRFLNFSQVFRWEQSTRDNQTMILDGMYTDRIAALDPWEMRNKNTVAGLDSRLYGKFNIGKVENTWVVGSDFRQYDYKWNVIADKTPGYNGYPGEDGYYLVDIFNPHNDYSRCVDIHSSKCETWNGTYNYSYFQEGVYFQDQIKWKGLSVLLGGRQDWVNTHYHGTVYSNRTDDHSITLTRLSDAPRPQTAFTWRAGLIYNFAFGLSPYFSYSTSFIPQSGSDWQGRPQPPLKGQQKEVGIKYKVPGRDILITAAAYDIDETNYLVTDYLHPGYSANAGRVNAKGFEVAANANITHDLRLIASYSYNSMTYASTNLTAAAQLPDGGYGPAASEKGKYVQGVPRNMFSFFLNYSMPKNIIPGLAVNGGMRYVGFTYDDAVNTFKVPAYYLFDIGMHYDFGQKIPMLKGLQAQLAVSNLTNKYYVASCGGNYACYIGQGRRVYGNLSYSW
ncbi:TonB-dependent siderophore receptor [Acetobacter pasteurianus]|uniref:TonB-dependent siderophore receptor n=1 Tax=Acetobacter pasteurianus TaxID=438 RepID=UPI00286C0730|nr:TonB-dependent siderophore receptor [Acetobacter pasteurianus]WKC16607.1 TonB-dependent siderophore receptor [Acetobacter pasteurianus]